jgi:hypothetical protein
MDKTPLFAKNFLQTQKFLITFPQLKFFTKKSPTANFPVFPRTFKKNLLFIFQNLFFVVAVEKKVAHTYQIITTQDEPVYENCLVLGR